MQCVDQNLSVCGIQRLHQSLDGSIWQQAGMDDLLSRHVANCSSWICHHCRTVSTELADKLRVTSCLKNCSGAEHKNQKVSFTADDGCTESRFVTYSALGLLLFIRPQRACVAASFRSKFLEFSNLTISGIAPATDEFRPSRIIFVIVCVTVVWSDGTAYTQVSEAVCAG